MSTRLQIAPVPIRTKLYRTATGFETFVDGHYQLGPQPLTGVAGDSFVTMEVATRLSGLAVRFERGVIFREEDK